MPRGSDERISNIFALLYGPPKSMKTRWALSAAEYGFNVTLLDGDKGAKIVKTLSRRAQERVNIINCFDTQSRPVFAELLTRFMQNERILWDDTNDKYLSILEKPNPIYNYFELWSEKFGPNDILVVDTIRALIFSILWHHLKDNGIEIEKLDKQDWDAYYVQMTLMQTFFTRLRGFRGHCIFVNHEQVNEITEPGKDARGNPIRKATGEVVLQPLGSSRAQGAVMAGYFDDVLHFDLSGSKVYIDCKPSEKRAAGSRSFSLRELWEDFTFEKYAKLHGFSGSWETQSEGCIFHEAGTLTKRPGSVSRSDSSGGGKIVIGANKTIGATEIGEAKAVDGTATQSKPEPEKIVQPTTAPTRIGLNIRGKQNG